MIMIQSWSWGGKIADKKSVLNRSACICDLLVRAGTQKNPNCCIKKFRNSSIILYFVCSVMLCDGSVKNGGF